MDHLNQPTTDTTLPNTIAQAFEQWLDLDRQIMALLDADTDTGNQSRRQWAIECHASTLPAVTAGDVWALLRMTSDEVNDTPRSSQDRVVSRAYAEVAAKS